MFKFLHQCTEAIYQRITWGHWFTLFNIVIGLVIASRYAFNADWPNTLLGKVYFFISLFGHFGFVIFAIYVLLLFPLSFIIRNQLTFRAISVTVTSIGMTILLIDTEVFKTLYLHLSPLVWKLFISPKNINISSYWIFIISIFAILMVEIASSYWIWRKLRRFGRQKWGKCVAVFFIACFMATHLLYAWADFVFYHPITAQNSNYPLSYPMTAKTFFEKNGFTKHSIFKPHSQQQGRAESLYLDYPKNTLELDEPKDKINIVIVNIANLTSDMITTEDMPNLFNIRQNSLNFTKHYTAGDTETSSIVNLFYGLTGQYVDSILNEHRASPLITTLQKYQYQFGLFSVNGFKKPIYPLLFNKLKRVSTRSNHQVVTKWQQWFERNNTVPFFSYLDLVAPSDTQQLDTQIQQLWQNLQSQDLLQNTLVMITSNLNKNNNPKNPFGYERTQVPMMIYWQGKSEDYQQLSSHLDVMPTLLNEFLGVQNPTSDYAQGINVMQDNSHEWLLSANHKWRVAIMPDNEQYQISPHKGHFRYFNAEGQQQDTKVPLELFLQLILDSNQFVEKQH